jgi:hypothetical protein
MMASLNQKHSLLIFTVVRESFSTQGAIMQKRWVKGLSNGPDWHIAQLGCRRGTGEHVLYCDGSFKELAAHTALEEMLSCKNCQL